MRVLVIGGGISDEREVSLKSSRAIFQAAKTAGYDAHYYDWDGSQEWLNVHVKKFDVVLPILHGEGGEDGVIQNILEVNQSKFLGSSTAVAKKCFDKQMTRRSVEKLGYAIPRGAVMNHGEYLKSDYRARPHVVKPIMAGSSIHTHIITDSDIYDLEKVKKTFDFYTNVLVEDCIIGNEITVGYLEGRQLPVIEIIPPAGEFFDYENKYNGRTIELCPPKNISWEIQKKAIEAAADIHRKMGCRDISRSDFMIQDGEIFFLEINTIPGMTDQSLFPKAAQVAGLDFPKLVDYMITIVEKKG